MLVRFVLPDAYRIGGRVRSMFNLAGSLAGSHDVEIASLEQSQPDPALPLPSGVTVVPTLTERSVADYLSGRDGILIGTRPEINVLIARHRRPGTVAIGQDHFHLGHYDDQRRAMMRKWYPKLDVHVSLTSGDAAAYRDVFGESPRSVSIPNAVDDPGDVRAALTNKVVVAAGRLTRQKGYDLLLRAWRRVSQVHPDWQLRIFGDGKNRDKLEAQRTRLRLGDSVLLPGFTNQLHHELAQGSFFVLSSRFEGLPMVMLEAMTVGLPVVSFDCPTGPRELIRGDEGVLVPADDVRGLAAAMNSMIELGPDRIPRGAAALLRSQEYRLPAITARWNQLFDSLSRGTA